MMMFSMTKSSSKKLWKEVKTEREGAGWTLMTYTACVDLGFETTSGHFHEPVSRSEGKGKGNLARGIFEIQGFGSMSCTCDELWGFDTIFSIRKSIQHFVPTMILHTGVC